MVWLREGQRASLSQIYIISGLGYHVISTVQSPHTFKNQKSAMISSIAAAISGSRLGLLRRSRPMGMQVCSRTPATTCKYLNSSLLTVEAAAPGSGPSAGDPQFWTCLSHQEPALLWSPVASYLSSPRGWVQGSLLQWSWRRYQPGWSSGRSQLGVQG